MQRKKRKKKAPFGSSCVVPFIITSAATLSSMLIAVIMDWHIVTRESLGVVMHGGPFPQFWPYACIDWTAQIDPSHHIHTRSIHPITTGQLSSPGCGPAEC